MNSSKMFWGSFLITIGLLSLLVKYDLIQSSFNFVWNIWPLIFVFWGLGLILRQSFVKPIISLISGIFTAILIYGIIYSLLWAVNFHVDENDSFTQNYSKELDANTKIVNLTLDAGAGSFTIRDSTSNLIDASSSGLLSQYNYNYFKDSSEANIDINLDAGDFHFLKNMIKNQLSIKLNTNPIWNFRFNIGASKNIFDFSTFKVNELSIKTGASNSRIKLGDKNDETNVDIDMGVSSLTLEIPEHVGCKVETDLSLVNKKFDGFTKKEKGIYQTENFEKSKKKILINVKGAVSSLKILRY
ncbi:LiaI-LiaF-like domain-containing protein [Stygiobacter electus]|uniref:DUF5668 domain-containing protein n=1 Tax=Stygiobacter electus TaxID=3032292 RepID=A0AAE3TB80_9BACT|nr:DUF5668 domain-containing protein [Stygiobacter electus]MDF1610530.1 DUF5668 domain-containing protein [Stygiobacter electus]